MPPTVTDFAYKTIFVSLGSTVVICAAGMLGLAALDKKIPPELGIIPASAIAAMGGILSPSPLFKKD